MELMRLARVRRTHRQAAAVNNGAACPGTNLSAQPQTPLTRITDATNSHPTAPMPRRRRQAAFPISMRPKNSAASRSGQATDQSSMTTGAASPAAI